MVLLLLRKSPHIAVDDQLLFQGMSCQCFFHLFATLVLILGAEEGVALIDAAINKIIEFTMALLIVVPKIRIVAAVLDRLVR